MSQQPTIIHPDDSRLTWYGAVSLQRTPEWVMPWRMPYEDRSLFPPLVLQERAAMPAGVRIAFRTDSNFVAGRVSVPAESGRLDLARDGQVVATLDLTGRDSFRFDDLSTGEKLIELWLPQFGEFRLHGIELSPGSRLTAAIDPRPRWITYGSSITQCRAAEGPTQTWPAIVARGRGLNLTCLGYGGQCHLDPMIARMIRDVPAEYLSMCVGINIYGASSLGPRTFQAGIIGFVKIVREKHPETPLVVMSPIYSPPREETANAVGFTLATMREDVAAAVDALRARGDQHIHYVDGLSVFGPELGHLLPDNLHPNAEGYKLMGANFLREVAEKHFF